MTLEVTKSITSSNSAASTGINSDLSKELIKSDALINYLVVNFTRAAAAELAKYNITVNTICPGYFYTELTTAVLDTDTFQEFAKTHVPMQRYGNEGELNAGAIFLASEEASYVTGVILPIDGGYTCV